MSEKSLTGFVKPGRQRSFGRTASRMGLAAQRALDDRLTPWLVPLPSEGGAFNLDAAFTGSGPLTVEVGMGSGVQLFARALAAPMERFLGIEVYKNGLRSLVKQLEVARPGNLKICAHDARAVLEALPPASVDRLLVLYPDPWPKKKHHKRRIINGEFLNLTARVVRPGGELFIATDIPDYACWILREVFTHGGFVAMATSPAHWATPPEGWVSTKYEQKALREGRYPWYFTFRRLLAPLPI